MKHVENCRQLLELMSDYIDGELNQNLCAELELHLTDCEDCRIVVDTLRKTVNLYHLHNSQLVLPPEVRERLYRCLDLNNYYNK